MPVMAATRFLQRVIHPSGSYISVIAWPVSYENPVECLPQQKQSSALFFIEPVHNFHQCLTARPGRALIKQAELLCAVSHSGEHYPSFRIRYPGFVNAVQDGHGCINQIAGVLCSGKRLDTTIAVAVFTLRIIAALNEDCDLTGPRAILAQLLCRPGGKNETASCSLPISLRR